MTSREEEAAQLHAEVNRLHAMARRDREALDWEAEACRVLRRLVCRQAHQITQLQVENERLLHRIASLEG